MRIKLQGIFSVNRSRHIYFLAQNIFFLVYVVTESFSYTLSGALHTAKKETTPWVKWSLTRVLKNNEEL